MIFDLISGIATGIAGWAVLDSLYKLRPKQPAHQPLGNDFFLAKIDEHFLDKVNCQAK
jgi:hypothetical protein